MTALLMSLPARTRGKESRCRNADDEDEDDDDDDDDPLKEDEEDKAETELDIPDGTSCEEEEDDDEDENVDDEAAFDNGTIGHETHCTSCDVPVTAPVTASVTVLPSPRLRVTTLSSSLSSPMG